ncbi:MAG: hypothetical protein ACE5K1_08295 [Acidiferrobacterales bacterium]
MPKTQRGHPHRPSPALTVAAVLAGVGAWLAPANASGEVWHYTLGQLKADQQANFCLDESTVHDIARIFTDRGPRAGYAALDRSSGCFIRVASFTPKKVVKRVTIETGSGGDYTITFVKVRMADGRTQYLVTTRDVRKRE